MGKVGIWAGYERMKGREEFLVVEPSPDIGCTAYDALMADLELLGWGIGDLAGRLGIPVRRVYQWKQTQRVPRWCEAYVELAMKVEGGK